MVKRVILLILDGCGAGAAPDAALFGDVGENEPNTLSNTARAVGGLRVPNMRRLGLGRIAEIGPGPNDPVGAYGKLREISMGKDTVTGHWEMMGIHTSKPFPTYPQGFPPEVVDPFEDAIGEKALGNYPASGTEIIKQLGEEHLRTGRPILYTSADSVFQIAAHEERYDLERLYDVCRVARRQLVPPHNVQRVIARPFLGETAGDFWRTERRKDFPLEPPPNLLDVLASAGVGCWGVGVIGEVFLGRGLAHTVRTRSNPEHHAAVLEAMRGDAQFIFANFEDTDMLFGHRNDPHGFANCLEQFDTMLGETLAALLPSDLLVITADHGNDPTTPSTDHSREYAPLLAYGTWMTAGRDLGIRSAFADIGATIGEAFGVPCPIGSSFLGVLH